MREGVNYVELLIFEVIYSYESGKNANRSLVCYSGVDVFNRPIYSVSVPANTLTGLCNTIYSRNVFLKEDPTARKDLIASWAGNKNLGPFIVKLTVFLPYSRQLATLIVRVVYSLLLVL